MFFYEGGNIHGFFEDEASFTTFRGKLPDEREKSPISRNTGGNSFSLITFYSVCLWACHKSVTEGSRVQRDNIGNNVKPLSRDLIFH